MVEVATKRLVLLAADEDYTVSFDVRSLQELMAGVALLDDGEDKVRANLTAAAAPRIGAIPGCSPPGGSCRRRLPPQIGARHH